MACLASFSIGRKSNSFTLEIIPLYYYETTTSTKKSSGKLFTMQSLRAMRNETQDLVSLLEQYYGGQEQAKNMMLNSWLSSWEFNSTEKLVDTMTRAIVTPDQDDFIIGIIGSSVAAGNDNCAYDSYPSQLERTLSPIWKAAGMKLVVHNSGAGQCHDSHLNQVYCVKQNVSPNSDIVQYTWTYYEANAGENALKSRESLVRWTQMLQKQPPVHVLNLGGLPAASSSETELAKYYSAYGYNAFYSKSGYKNGGFDYKAAAQNGTDRFGWGNIGDGYHNITRYGESIQNADRRTSLGVVMRNWHPGPLYFQFIADTFAYVYSKAVLEALDLIEREINNGTDPRDNWTASKRKIMLKHSLPPPRFCDPLYCVVGEAPSCLNYGKPTFGWWGAMIEDPNDDLNPHHGELQNWTLHYSFDTTSEGYIPAIPKEDQAFFGEKNDTCRHNWACGGMSATGVENGSVVFRLPKLKVGLVVICGVGPNGGKASKQFVENSGLEIRYNQQLLDPAEWDLFPDPRCVRLQKEFPANFTTPTGHAYLAIKALNLTNPLNISHVITL